MSDHLPENPDGNEEPVVGDPPPDASTLLSNANYDRLRFLAVIVLPALGALYFGLAQIWGLPKAEQVVGTIVVIDTFAGVLLRAARKSYENSDARFDGDIYVEPNEAEGLTNLNVKLDSSAVAGKDAVLVRVHKV